MRSGLILVALAATVSALTAFASTAVAGADGGQAAPPLAVEKLDGGTFDLGALRGKVVVVNFWATWCPPCRAEMPALDAFYRRYHDRGVEMLGLSVDRPHDRADVVRFARTVSYPLAMLADVRMNGFGSQRVLPVTYVIDMRGVVRAVLRPDRTPVTAESLAEAVLPLLPKATQPTARAGHRLSGTASARLTAAAPPGSPRRISS